MTGYTKLFGSIIASTIWREPHHIRIVWVTMLALSDKHGVVEASIPGLADLSRVTIAEAEEAIAALSSPDTYSRTKDHEGRRIETVDGGWRLLNHAKYRAKMSTDERREYLRVKQQEHRAKKSQQGVNKRSDLSTKSTHTEAEAEAEAEADLTTLSGCQQPDGIVSVSKAYSPESRVLVHFLNEQTGSQYRERDSSLKFIQARLNEPDVTLDGCKQMIVRQTRIWKGTNMEQYLRPSTLFNQTKFSEYYAARNLPLPANGQPSPSNHRNNGIAKPSTGPSIGELLRRKAEADSQKR